MPGYVKGYISRPRTDYPPKIHASDAVPEGSIVVIDNIYTPFSNGVYLHPVDAIWAKHHHEPKKAHKMWERWFEKWLDQRVKEALDRIDATKEKTDE